MIHAILAFFVSHWLHALIGGGITAALGAGGSMLGWPVVLKYWKEIVGFICLMLIVALVLALYAKLKDTEAAAATDKANYATLQNQANMLNQDNANLTKQLQAQSDSITRAAQDAAGVMAQAKLDLAAAQARQTADAGKIAKLEARSQTNEGSCDDEIAVLRSGM